MGWFLASHLNDKLAQVALNCFDALVLQIMVQLNLFADHRFAFHHQLTVFIGNDVVNDLAGFGRSFRPVNFNTQLGQIFFQLFQQCRQFGQRTLTDMFTQITQALQLFFICQNGFALGHQHIHRCTQAFTQRLVLQRNRGVLLECFRLHMEFNGLGTHAFSSKSAGEM